MRIRRFLPLLLAALLAFSGAALAGEATYNGIHYIFAGETQGEALLTISLSAESVDARTLETQHVSQLTGAVFGVYARGADGALVPWPDPKEPSRPLTIATQAQPVSAALPRSAELYLCQLSAPDGYAMALTEPVAVNVPCEMALSCRKLGETCVRVALWGDATGGAVPLAGVRFALKNAQGAYEAATDESGVALFEGVAPGEYTLAQQTAAGAYTIDQEEQTVAARAGETTLVEITNSRPGTLSLSVLGASFDREAGATRFVPLGRSYEVYDEVGALAGVLVGGETLELPAAQNGTRYVLRAVDGAEDGFAADMQAHEVTLYSGAVTPAQTLANAGAGFFDFEQTDAASGLPVAGGTFALYDAAGAEVLRFEADGAGRFASVEPLAAGEYTVRMVRAAEGRPYDASEIGVTIAPYLQQKAAAAVRFASAALPETLTDPQVACDAASLASLFEQDADVAVALRVEGLLQGVCAEFDVTLPDAPGLSGAVAKDGAGALHLARRFALPDAEEIRELTLSGTVRLSFEYAVDAQGTRETKTVAAPFAVTAATFEAATPVGYAVTGRLSDADGAPLAGREVSLLGENGEALETVWTDPWGAYAFERTGTARVAPDEGCGVRYTDGGAQMLPLRTRTARIEGGEAVQGVEITVACGGETRTARAGDTLSFRCLPDEEISVSVPEGVLYTVEGETYRLWAAASLRGAACDPEGTPLAGARVRLNDEEIVTGADGAFAFEKLYPGEYTLSFEAPQGYLVCGEAQENVAVSDGEALEHNLTAMRPARVEGTLREEGAPLAGIAVRLDGQTAETDESGRFAFENLTAGAYALSFETPDDMAVQGAPNPLEITRSGETVSLELTAIRAASAAGVVWHDADDNGLRSAGEPGVSGAVVTLTDGAGRTVSAVTTASDGAFAFEGLLPGEYRIAVELPESMIFSRHAEGMERLISGHDSRTGESEAFSLASGEKRTGLLCGAVVSGRVEGLVWEDENGDGGKSGAKAPLQNAVVTLEKDGETVQTAVTGADGRYAFEHLRSGDYTVRAALPDGMLPTTDETAEISVRTWRTQFEKDFAGVSPAEIRVAVFCDETADGAQQANEAGLIGATVLLVSGEGARETIAASAVTDENGAARFADVYPGTYRLRAECDGWTQTTQTGEIVAASGNSIDAQRIGLTKTGRISGAVFADENYDGLRSEGEAAVSAVATLLDGAGNTLAKTRTGADGAYCFDGLTAGKYAVSFQLAEGWQFTRNREDAPSFNSDVPETLGSEAATAVMYLPMGETLLADAGAYRAAKLSGAVWMYPNGSEGVADAAVRLVREGAVFRETTTSARGAYAFEALPPGEYTVEAVLPDGMLSMNGTESATLAMGETRANVRFAAVYAARIAGTTSGSDVALTLRRASGETWECGEAGAFTLEGLLPGEYTLEARAEAGYALRDFRQETQTFTLAQGETREFLLETQPEAVISGSVWYDENGDGQPDGEAPLPGVTVTLTLAEESAAKPLRTAVTDADGAFRFDALAAGEYRLAFAADDAALCFDETETFAPAEGERIETSVAAWKPAAVSGSVWDDKNADGLFRKTETALENIRVELLDAQGGTIAETMTGADGAYAFENLRPGEMRVRFTLAAGCVFTDHNENGSLVPTTDANVGTTELFALRAGETRADVNAGSLTAGRVGDRVWLDENGNGLQDSGEPGMEGVTVVLLHISADYAETEAARTATDANGRYRFDAVRPGTYRVQIELPDGFVPTVSMPKFPTINSKLDANSKRPELTGSFDVRSGEAYLSADAGLVKK